MRLDQFTFLHFDAREKVYRYLAYQIDQPTADPQELHQQLDQALQERLADGAMVYTDQQGQEVKSADLADNVLFCTNWATPTGELIYAKCLKNRRPGAVQPWFGLFFEVERPDTFVIGDMYFDSWSDGQRFLEEVAHTAIPERWHYNDYQSKQNHPMLKSFLEHTLIRIKQQEQLLRAEQFILWNTGLINHWFKEIYVLCECDPEYPNRLVHPRMVLENDRMILETFKNEKPTVASFFSKISDVIFDPTLPVNTDDDHIIEDNYERIPEEYRSMRKSQIFALFQSAIEFARIMARRNYKLVVPHFYNGQIQFLMPVFLSGEFTGRPDFALALEKIGSAYRGNTILTLDMAYQNARLIAKPETDWLSPR